MELKTKACVILSIAMKLQLTVSIIKKLKIMY